MEAIRWTWLIVVFAVADIAGPALAQTTTTTLPRLECEIRPVGTHFDGRTYPLPIRAQAPTSDCANPSNGTEPCGNKVMNDNVESFSTCVSRTSVYWPHGAMLEADRELGHRLDSVCAAACLPLGCKADTGLCVSRGWRHAGGQCEAVAEPDDCPDGEGQYVCRVTLSLCKCRCRKALR
jgi:hypothetical protein